jgi:hypothetical protein
VAVAVSHVLLPFGQFFHAADEVSAREILRGVLKIFPRQAEVLGGGTAATMVVAAMVMMAMMAVVTMVVVVMIEQITQETSDETSRETQTWKHSYSPLSLGVPAPASCRRSGCLQTVRLRQKQIRPSVICGTFDPVRHNSPASSAAARMPRPKMPSFSGNSMPSKARLRLTMQIEYGLRPAPHTIARRHDRLTAITPGVDKACDAEDFVNELRSMDRDAACCTEHQRP